jgi:hypothetical protein
MHRLLQLGLGLGEQFGHDLHPCVQISHPLLGDGVGGWPARPHQHYDDNRNADCDYGADGQCKLRRMRQ